MALGALAAPRPANSVVRRLDAQIRVIRQVPLCGTSRPAARLATVRDVIGDVGARDIPEIVVFNKADLVDEDRRILLRGLAPGALFVSSQTVEGIQELRAAIEHALPLPAVEVRALSCPTTAATSSPRSTSRA
jgi:50S ribosomal subunit-associated GTPase HflX